ncbi:CTD kinase subunit gamma CTK3-domain-containing protein [Durotheca rogersii]|uniref:CTD kinase subunit gamma CTK3-domain-containing protein n=1 Tax=Durotheca rogersii TaxID=419775 RepID=UPI00221EFCBA|nr:CTD kinase subunit gamma CTK3-domain-containing protein [Durotheca rogersii]KAI5863351.1 CTD kinase subunit gamma CTK3-domain-containing protein [Durotheca rogersii]
MDRVDLCQGAYWSGPSAAEPGLSSSQAPSTALHPYSPSPDVHNGSGSGSGSGIDNNSDRSRIDVPVSDAAMATADPFEVRMRFSAQLEHLNASTTSSQKAAQYALKYKDMDEDLHSCILEQLEKTSMNTRANIMYFIEHLLEMASKDRSNEYIRMMQRDIIRVVDAVCPEDGSGAANVKVVRKVLQGLKNKTILLEQTVIEIEACLKDRDTSASDLGFSSPANGDKTSAPSRPSNGTSHGSTNRLDKRQIEQRIEEDRERHKRMRESMWAVPAVLEEDAAKVYEDTSDLGEDDHILGNEELDEMQQSAAEAARSCRHSGRSRTNGTSSH